MFNVFFLSPFGEASLKDRRPWKRNNQKRFLNRKPQCFLNSYCYLVLVETASFQVGPREEWMNRKWMLPRYRGLDARNASGVGDIFLLSGFFSLVSLKHSNGLIHLKHTHNHSICLCVALLLVCTTSRINFLVSDQHLLSIKKKMPHVIF